MLELLWPKQPWPLLVQHWELLLLVALGETWQLPERVWTGQGRWELQQRQWELPQWQALPRGLGSQVSRPWREGLGPPQLELQGRQGQQLALPGPPGQGPWDRS